MNDPTAPSRDVVRRVVEEVVRDVLRGDEPASTTPVAPRPSRLGPVHRPPLAPRVPHAIEALVRSNPARLIQGRVGTRYLTEVYVGLRADHAIAIDAVNSAVPEGWAADRGWLSLKTRAEDHHEFLLHPELGRRLDDSSRALLAERGEKGVDVAIIAGDGLSAHALITNGPALVDAMTTALRGVGFRVGAPMFVKFARIGVQDEVGVVLGAKATAIIVGERPGLGTGDSLSVYTAFGPKIGQDNSEKDCISNIRAVGLVPSEAGARVAELMRRTFLAGGGGVRLV